MGIIYYFSVPSTQELPPVKRTVLNGVSLVNPPFPIDSLKMTEVKRVNANWVAVIPMAFARQNDPEVRYDRNKRWWGESVDGTARLIELAHKNDLKVFLKPHVWAGRTWIGDYDLDSEDSWKEWESSYRDYIMTFAHLADSMGVELFCVGTEFKIPAVERPEYWEDLIHEIRGFYTRELTYASNWDNYDRITFWGELDYVGVDGYFPLVQESDPDLSQLKDAWTPIVKKLENFSRETGKNILFAEYGFQSVDGGAGNHWDVVKTPETLNMDLQARAYECLYDCLWDEPWFSGGFLWKWHFRDEAGGPTDAHFTPQGKPTEKVIAKWYGEFPGDELNAISN